MQKREIIFVYLPNTSHFMHFPSVRQKKWNSHNTAGTSGQNLTRLRRQVSYKRCYLYNPFISVLCYRA